MVLSKPKTLNAIISVSYDIQLIYFYSTFKIPEAYNETMQTAWPMHDMPKDGAKIQFISQNFNVHL